MGRPATTPVSLRDGYYIELRHKGEKRGIKLRRESIEQVQASIRKYNKSYDVHYIGLIKKGKVVDDKLPK
ncbi:MAG: hypothetical protein KI790_12145 [Cyclobacteriaceae bacterium]|nr:hypothetical protein [Cyclobacteriaceae bacterium HetDA_MAG_MS6]